MTDRDEMQETMACLVEDNGGGTELAARIRRGETVHTAEVREAVKMTREQLNAAFVGAFYLRTGKKLVRLAGLQ